MLHCGAWLPAGSATSWWFCVMNHTLHPCTVIARPLLHHTCACHEILCGLLMLAEPLLTPAPEPQAQQYLVVLARENRLAAISGRGRR